MRLHSVPTILALAALLSAGACSDSPTDEGPSLTVSPATAQVQVGSELSLTASVANLADASVTWAVDCGAIDAAGAVATFTAPWGPRSCSATATSVADPSLSGTAAITVTPVAPQDNLLAPGGFDSGFAPFTPVTNDPPVVEWSPEDARGSATSGSALMHHPFVGNNGAVVALNFCFTPEPGAEYRAGGSARLTQAVPGVWVIFSALVYTNGCAEFDTYLKHGAFAANSAEWVSDAFTFTAPAGTKPIKILLGISKDLGVSTDISALVDDLFVMRVR